jgi:hypothetical protein
MEWLSVKFIELHDPERLKGVLEEQGFPLGELVNFPVSAIENMAVRFDGRFRGVCTRACIGCSAAAIHPSQVKGSSVLLTPQLLQGILDMARGLAGAGVGILSTVRLNLFSGSNELEHPHCLSLRRMMSSYFREMYGIPYGGISSDIVFHVAPSRTFRKNLMGLLNEPLLFDNICVALDEQIPFADRPAYEEYLEALAWTWQSLSSALRLDLDKLTAGGRREPRVILNFLLPPPGSAFLPAFRELFPGGPPRATTYHELRRRYVEPFVGKLLDTSFPVPEHHVFTTSVGSLTGVSGSLVFVSEAVFEPVGRARRVIEALEPFPGRLGPHTPQVRTKIYPIDRSAFAFQAELALNRFSDGDLGWPNGWRPAWIDSLSTFQFRLP